MNNFMSDLEYIRTYLDDLLILSDRDFKNHLFKVGTVLTRLKNVGLKVYVKNELLVPRA